MAWRRLIATAANIWGWVSYRSAVLASAVLAIMVLLVSAEVLSRKLINQSIFIVYDVVAFGLAAVVFLGVAEVHRKGGHIRITGILKRLPASVRNFLEVLYSLVTIFYLSYLLVFAVPMVVSAYRGKDVTVSAVPLLIWPAEIFMVIGVFVFVILEFIFLLRRFWPAAEARTGSASRDSSTSAKTD